MLVSSRGYVAFAEDASGRYLTSVRVGKAAAVFANSASRSGDKLNPLSFMTLLAARRQMVWVGLGLPPAGTSSPPPKVTSTASASGSAQAASPPRAAPPHPEMTGARGRPRTMGHRAAFSLSGLPMYGDDFPEEC